MKQLKLYLLSGTFTLIIAAWTVYRPDKESTIAFVEAPWEEVLKTAQTENKVIFLDLYATWCGPCKMLKRDTFTDPEVGTFFNANFINVSLDAEKGEGRMLAKRYELHAYPTLYFLYPDGSIKESALGYHTPDKLLKVAKKQLEAN